MEAPKKKTVNMKTADKAAFGIEVDKAIQAFMGTNEKASMDPIEEKQDVTKPEMDTDETEDDDVAIEDDEDKDDDYKEPEVKEESEEDEVVY